MQPRGTKAAVRDETTNRYKILTSSNGFAARDGKSTGRFTIYTERDVDRSGIPFVVEITSRLSTCLVSRRRRDTSRDRGLFQLNRLYMDSQFYEYKAQLNYCI